MKFGKKQGFIAQLRENRILIIVFIMFLIMHKQTLIRLDSSMVKMFACHADSSSSNPNCCNVGFYDFFIFFFNNCLLFYYLSENYYEGKLKIYSERTNLQVYKFIRNPLFAGQTYTCPFLS